MKALIIVFIGGGVGSMLRYIIGLLIGPYSTKFPYATFLANVISCIILGVLIGLSFKNNLSNEMKLLLMTGLCGGFSTFSAFSAESYQLLHTENYIILLTYMCVSFMVGMICIFFGMKMVSGY